MQAARLTVDGLTSGDEVVINPALAWGDDEGSASEAFNILGWPTEGTFAESVVSTLLAERAGRRRSWHWPAAACS